MVEVEVCLDNEASGKIEHLAKNKVVVSDSEILKETEVKRKEMKEMSSKRVVCKPFKLNI